MKRILLTNDDGIESAGLLALAESLLPLGDITILAPIADTSAAGHAMTRERPLRILTIREGVYTVDGTPTDCVNIAIAKLLEAPPDLVVSGINAGYNLGDDVTYSGTVAGAMEGALLGIPAMAVSLQRQSEVCDFAKAARASRIIARQLLARGLPPCTFLNVNIPRGRVKGFRVTVLAEAKHESVVREEFDSWQRPCYWMQEGLNTWQARERSDYQAVNDGWISITPLHSDLTNYGAISAAEGLGLRTIGDADMIRGPMASLLSEAAQGRDAYQSAKGA